MAIESLSHKHLCRRCDPDSFAFESTEELPDLVGYFGQDRAIDAIQFGVGVHRKGYNIFALGPTGTGKYTLVRSYVEQRAETQSPPDDWCYVNNFDQPHKPRALRLPAGTGKALRKDMTKLVEDLHHALASAFESEEFQASRVALEEDFQERHLSKLTVVQDRAKEKGLALLRTQGGLVFAPLRDGELLEPSKFQQLDEEEQERIKAEIDSAQELLQKILFQTPQWERDFRDRMQALKAEISGFVLDGLLEDMRHRYADFDAVLSYLDEVKQDVVANLDDFLPGKEDGGRESGLPEAMRQRPMRRYEINLLVDAEGIRGAPVIYDSNPTYSNLVGRIEQMAQFGALVTDFTLIKPGLLHRANGGYLLLDAIKILTTPYAWDGLKRALQFGEARIESPMQLMSLTSTISLEPEPIPLDLKVILLGDRRLYYLLSELDPEFDELFRVAMDFDDEFVRDENSQRLYAQLLATITRKEGLHAMDRTAIARVIEYSSRCVSDAERLTARMQSIVDLLVETDHWATAQDATLITAEHVQHAVDAKRHRANRVQHQFQDEIVRETLLIDTEGEVIGQVNGLAVIKLADFYFGKPSKITATVHFGRGEVVDIEREAELGGPLHAKGILILSGYLRARFAADRPLSLGASIVFEQSYSGVEGDSASSAELYALLSAIAQIPIKQSLAVTGSVNQHGQIQAIGGVNEKIEGFFDLCSARGLSGSQGVLIPQSNVKHLMLCEPVLDAVRDGKFAVYPVDTIDQGIELLTGLPAGAIDEDGSYPPNSVNGRVASRLQALADLRKEYDRPSAKVDSGHEHVDAATNTEKKVVAS